MTCRVDCDEVYRGMARNMLNDRLYGHQSSLNKLDRAEAPEEIKKSNPINSAGYTCTHHGSKLSITLRILAQIHNDIHRWKGNG